MLFPAETKFKADSDTTNWDTGSVPPKTNNPTIHGGREVGKSPLIRASDKALRF
jgi:hypothetical protein